MTLDESIHGLRLRVMRRAEQIGNVSQVCREFGISRTLFYRWRRRFERYGVDGVHPAPDAGARAGRPGAGRRRRPSGWCRAWRSARGPGAAAGSPAIWPGPGSSAWRPAPCSGSCAESAWPRGGRGWPCSSSRRSRRWGC